MNIGVVAGAAAAWNLIFPKPTLTCVCEGAQINTELLGLLGRQLDRCGPSQLGPPPPASAGPFESWAPCAFVLLVGWCLGVATAAWWWQKLPQSEPRATQAVDTDDFTSIVPQTPAARRAAAAGAKVERP